MRISNATIDFHAAEPARFGEDAMAGLFGASPFRLLAALQRQRG
jgi:hypothetical protein